MKVSEINKKSFRIALPNSIAYAIIDCEVGRQNFIAKHGDVEVTCDRFGRYQVDDFVESRKNAEKLTLEACKLFGNDQNIGNKEKENDNWKCTS